MRAQRPREAIHYAYWAAVYRLEEQGAWRPDASRTPREYLRLLGRASQHRRVMAELTRDFEKAWYGYRPVTATDADSALRQLESLGCNLQSRPATASF
jgi:hypothetical protein